MITADQIVAHLVGDYLLQSDWMANKKRTESLAAIAHAATYTLCFLPWLVWEDRSPSSVFLATYTIFYSHFLIDRYGLARYVVWAKNFLAPRWIEAGVFEDRVVADWHFSPGCGEWFRTARHVSVRKMLHNYPWSACSVTGYPPDRPPFLAVWLLIIADNTLHILVNGAALKWL